MPIAPHETLLVTNSHGAIPKLARLAVNMVGHAVGLARCRVAIQFDELIGNEMERFFELVETAEPCHDSASAFEAVQQFFLRHFTVIALDLPIREEECPDGGIFPPVYGLCVPKNKIVKSPALEKRTETFGFGTQDENRAMASFAKGSSWLRRTSRSPEVGNRRIRPTPAS